MSETANDTLIEQIARESIAARIAAVATKAVVHPVWVMGLVDGENANILRSDDHVIDDDKMIHAYMVTRIKGKSGRVEGGKTTGLQASRARSNPVTVKHEFIYRIRGIRFFKHGGTAGVHSENEFKEEITKIASDLASRFNLDLDQTVDGHEFMQIEAEGFNTYGKKLCHQSDLTITVCFTQTINPS